MTTPPGPGAWGPPPYDPYGNQPPPAYAPPPYPGYPPPPVQPPYPVKPPVTVWAVVALAAGLLGGVLIALVCGFVALSKTRSGQYSGRGLAIGGIAASAVWAVVIAVGIVFLVTTDDGSTSATSLEVGDCLKTIPDDGNVLSVPRVDCAQPHLGEVYAAVPIPGSDYPDADTLREREDQCGEKLIDFSATAATDPSFDIVLLSPSAVSWRQGDREVTCIVRTTVERTGSLQGK